MVTTDEETQAKEFLKRAEIRTMKKDLAALREVDALKERDKIVKLKTLEEQLSEKAKTDLKDELVVPVKVKPGIKEILQRGEAQEKIAEKDLKNYATEAERQQIFLLESERLALEKESDAIDKESNPALKLEKNGLLLQKRDQQEKLSSVLEQEKKLEGEQKLISEKSQATTIPDERKGLEQSRWDIDKKIQEIEKRRWEIEKQIQETDVKIAQIDKSSGQNIAEKNNLRDKILGVDKLLRDIYSTVMTREEEKRAGRAQEQITKKDALAGARSEQMAKVQREQWRKPMFDVAAEEEQRKKFLQDVAASSEPRQGREQGANQNQK